jgi:predicted Zn-dependent peptidase
MGSPGFARSFVAAPPTTALPSAGRRSGRPADRRRGRRPRNRTRGGAGAAGRQDGQEGAAGAGHLRAWVSTFADRGLYEIYATARPGKTIKDIEAILLPELARARDEVVTDDELTRAKARLELGSLQALETMGGKAEQIGFYEVVLGDPGAAFQRLEAYRRATASDLRKAARRYIVDYGRTTIRVFPDATATSSEAAQ